ncbi:uncharacterized protein LOC104584890 isoform X3 [Brachypodium distachyon]|uniref:uncharacterized protein LOC104584890 isoform X3 n=1 Tax=Brachypodium distachyon TaxID=15368 RepID=UPI000D0DCD34|nr:uncharacterized protein LOC104584890 isoform X3 [Brachypodium distachyon]|eukprot:XP_024310616.1 uncharacterized protein LOC104584890 isoform X3 [Brachypodium distachyon]
MADNPPAVRTVRAQHAYCPANHVEVKVTAHGADTGKDAAGGGVAPTKSGRTAKLPLEKPEDIAAQAGTSALPPKPTQIQASIERLTTPVASNVNPVQLQAELELERQKLLKEAVDVANARQQLDISLREYNKARGLSSTALTNLSRVGEIRTRGKNLNAGIAREGRGAPTVSASFASALKPKYNTPVKNLRAAEAAAEELPNFTGEALRQQQLRVKELLQMANEQNEAYMRMHGKPDASQVIHSAADAGGWVVRQASSPGGKRDKSVTSGRDK